MQFLVEECEIDVYELDDVSEMLSLFTINNMNFVPSLVSVIALHFIVPSNMIRLALSAI